MAQLGSDVRGERRDVFGRSVAMNWDGSIIAVGAPMYDTGRRGEVRTLQWNADRSSWEQIGQVLEGDGGEHFFRILGRVERRWDRIGRQLPKHPIT